MLLWSWIRCFKIQQATFLFYFLSVNLIVFYVGQGEPVYGRTFWGVFRIKKQKQKQIDCKNKCYLHLRALIISSWPNAILTVPDLGGSSWCCSKFWPQGSANVPDKTLTTKRTSYVTSQAPPTARVLSVLMLCLQTGVMLNFRFAVRCPKCVRGC